MRHITNLDLTEYNSYRITAHCDNAFFPENEEDLIFLYNNRKGTPKILLGNGNNVILSKEFYPEDFIIFNGNFDKIQITKNVVHAEAGATLEQISLLALEHKLTGFEIFYDIPSSVGGAIVMNAGAGGEEIKDCLVKVRYLDLEDLQVKERQNQEIGFSYRDSFFQNTPSTIVLGAEFILKSGDQKKIQAKMEEVKKTRWAKQPREFPNCGSVFKRPAGRFVGPMLDELGLKGFTIGGAKISEKHSGFIVNTGNATGKGILDIITVVQERVKEIFGIELEVEQRII